MDKQIRNRIDWSTLYAHSATFHIYFTERGRGKTDTKAWTILETITEEDNIDCFIWLRRNWEDSANCTFPYFRDLIPSFCSEKEIKPSRFEIKREGVWYSGMKRIYFFDLFSYKKTRGGIARTNFQEIVFDEAIPVDLEFLYHNNKNEQAMFADFYKSVKRKEQPIKTTFLANPYSWSAWFLPAFDKNIFNLKNQAEELEKKNDNRGVLAVAKEKIIDKGEVEWLLYLNLIEGEKDPYYHNLQERRNPSLVNWDDFMFSLYTKSGQLKKYKIVHAIQDFYFCELGERKKNERYFFLHWSKNKKETDKELVNFCFSWEEKAKSKLENCLVKDKNELLKQWINMLKEGMILFADFASRDWFLEQIKKLT